MSSLPRFIPTLLALATLLAMAGCGENAAPKPTGPHYGRRLALEPAGTGEAASADADLGKRIALFEAHAKDRNRPWVIPAELEPGSFNRVVVSVTNRRRARMRLIFRSDQEIGADEVLRLYKESSPDAARLLKTPAILMPGSPDPQLVIFDVPALRRRDETIAQLVIIMESDGEAYRFHTADLLSMPLHAMLPDGSGELVNVFAKDEGGFIAEAEGRLGIGLTSDRPLYAETALPPDTAGCRLSLAVLQPEVIRVGNQKPRVKVSVTDSEGRSARGTLTLGNRVKGEEIWLPFELDLAMLKGQSATVRVALEVRGDLIGGCVLTPPLIAKPGAEPPTVLLITSDTHRHDALGLAKSSFEVRTPNLDAIAARGVRFTDCYSATNVTSPSHVTLMTGTSPRDTGIISNTGHMAEEAQTLAEHFRARGYTTYAAVSVRHLGPLGTGLGQGFDRITAPSSTVWDAEVTIDRLEEWLPDAAGRPLFVWLHLFDVHAPYAPPGEFDRRYYPAEKDPFDPALPQAEELDERWLGPELRGLRDIDFAVAQYRGEVDYMDRELGRLLSLPRFQQGIVAFTADHGESFGSGGVWFSHTGLYPANLHVPLLLAWPGSPAGVAVESAVESIDLGRTLLDLAGFEDVEFPGHSLLPALDGSRPVEARFALSANGNSAAVETGGYLLIMHLRRHDHHMLTPRDQHQIELFEVATDPRCQRDLMELEPTQTAGRAAALRNLLITWLGDASETSWARRGSEDAEALAQLAALGYAMDAPSSSSREWFDEGCDCNWCSRFAQ